MFAQIANAKVNFILSYISKWFDTNYRQQIHLTTKQSGDEREQRSPKLEQRKATPGKNHRHADFRRQDKR